MQTIKNLNQIKGGTVYSVNDQESPEIQAEIQRLFEEDRAAFLLLNFEGQLVNGDSHEELSL